ncbi:MAG: hypothetical protein K9M02_05970 [Thiohalocapsa sp.]|nr:hypothetical protein [Thiohalocapsa sp.]
MGKAFTEIAEGFKDAANHAKGEESGVVEHTPEALNVRAIREKAGMSQERFCKAETIEGIGKHGFVLTPGR